MSSDEKNSWWDSAAQPESIKATCKTMKFAKGHPLSVDLRYGEEDSIILSTLFFAATKG